MPKSKRTRKLKSTTLSPSAPDTSTPAPVHAPTPKPSRYIVDTILPKYELHIIGGPAHSGKTTLIFQTGDDIQAGRNVFGYPSHRIPFCLVSCVHSASACHDVMEKIDTPFPMYSFIDNSFDEDASGDGRPLPDKLDQVIDAANSIVPGTELILLDGLLRLFDGSINDNAAVGKFISGVVRKLQSRRITMIATGRSAKPKEASNGFRSIDRFLGATAWTEFSSTFIAIEPPRNAGVAESKRIVTLMPKRSSASFHHFKFNNEGILIETISADSAAGRIGELCQILAVHDEGEILDSATLVQIGKDLEIPQSTMYRYVALLLKQGRLINAGYGYYRIPVTSGTIQ